MQSSEERQRGDLPDALNVRGTGAFFFNERWGRASL
jgi:hypothetical protein